MPIENEVKIVLNPKFNAKSLKGWELKKIRQGYLGNTAHLIREGKDHFVVYRDWAGKDRHELEIRIPVEKDDFDALWTTCTDKHKRDYYFGNTSSMIEVGRLPKTPRIREYGDKCYFNYKDWVDGQDVRVEIGDKDPIPQKVFDDLWPNCQDTMYKDRYVLVENDIEWVVDFMRKGGKANGAVYFVLAEAEMPETMDKPKSIIKAISNDVIFEVPKGSKDYTSRKLCDETYAAQKLKEINYAP